MSYNYIDSLSSEARSRYLQKLDVLGLDKCPYQLPHDAWVDDPTSWPDIHYADIYHFLIETPGVFNEETMKSYRSLEAHRYFRAGFVQTVYHFKTDKGMLIFLADVKPPQRMNAPAHQPWVASDNSGRVSSAHCTCMAGLGESCSHVAAVLYKLEAAVRLGYNRVTCTEKPCEWNNFFTEKVTPSTIARISFYGEEVISRVQSGGRKRKASKCSEPPSKEEQLNFLNSLQGLKSKPVALSTFKETAHLFKQESSVPSINK